MGPGPLPWGLETVAIVCIDFHKLPYPRHLCSRIPIPEAPFPSSFLPAARATCDPRPPPPRPRSGLDCLARGSYNQCFLEPTRFQALEM